MNTLLFLQSLPHFGVDCIQAKMKFCDQRFVMKKIILLLLLFPIMMNVFSQNVGIGTSSPAFKLDVQGRMRVKTGTLNNVNTSSGIWFDDYRNGNNQFFFGMKDSIRGGFYGSGTGIGWQMLFNTRTGLFNDGFGLNGSISLYSGVTNHLGGGLHTDSNDLHIEARRGAIIGSRGNLILQYGDPQNLNIPGNVGIGNNDPQEKLDVSGNIKISGEIRRAATGTASLLPLCYGVVNADGTIVSGTGNFTVTRPDTGYYQVNISGLSASASVAVVTGNYNVSTFASMLTFSTAVSSNVLHIYCRGLHYFTPPFADFPVFYGSRKWDSAFSFVVYSL